MTNYCLHGELDPATQGIHVPYQWAYADATARLAATGFTADDVTKLALQESDQSLWMLVDESPITWQAIALSAHTHTDAASGGLLSGAVVSDYLDLAKVDEPFTPLTGYGRLYVKADGKLYFKDEQGVETDLTQVAPASAPASSAYVTYLADDNLPNACVRPQLANFSLDTYPTSPSIYDDEFDDGAIGAQWDLANGYTTLNETDYPGFVRMTVDSIPGHWTGANFDRHLTPSMGSLKVMVLKFYAKALYSGDFVGVYFRFATGGSPSYYDAYFGLAAMGDFSRLAFVAYPPGGTAYYVDGSVCPCYNTGPFYLRVVMPHPDAGYLRVDFSLNGMTWRNVYNQTGVTWTTTEFGIDIWAETGAVAHQVEVLADYFRVRDATLLDL